MCWRYSGKRNDLLDPVHIQTGGGGRSGAGNRSVDGAILCHQIPKNTWSRRCVLSSASRIEKRDSVPVNSGASPTLL